MSNMSGRQDPGWRRMLLADSPRDAVTRLVDGGAFQGGAVAAGCCAAQASSWRVFNPWQSPAGSNKHKRPNKPELKKLYLRHCLRKSHSCLWSVVLLLVLLQGSGLGDTSGWWCQFPPAVR